MQLNDMSHLPAEPEFQQAYDGKQLDSTVLYGWDLRF